MLRLDNEVVQEVRFKYSSRTECDNLGLLNLTSRKKYYFELLHDIDITLHKQITSEFT